MKHVTEHGEWDDGDCWLLPFSFWAVSGMIMFTGVSQHDSPRPKKCGFVATLGGDHCSRSCVDGFLTGWRNEEQNNEGRFNGKRTCAPSKYVGMMPMVIKWNTAAQHHPGIVVWSLYLPRVWSTGSWIHLRDVGSHLAVWPYLHEFVRKWCTSKKKRVFSLARKMTILRAISSHLPWQI